jgi:hypothetical protein
VKIRKFVIFGPSQKKIIRARMTLVKVTEIKYKDPHCVNLLQILHRVFFLSPPFMASFSHGKHGSAGISCDSCGPDGGYERNVL